MTAMNEGPLLHTEDLPSPLQNHMEESRAEHRTVAASVHNGQAAMNSFDLPESLPPPPVILPLSEIEKRAILEALNYTKGDHTMAAQLLGIGRTTLYRKLKEYRLPGVGPKPFGSAETADSWPRASHG
jgi:transcriptional regulator of acetoin/glycerol metabolism